MLNRSGHECDVCGANVRELRRGRCWGCYTHWVEARPVGIGAACVCCGDRRREILKTMELFKTWLPVCFNCAGKAARLPETPANLESLKALLSRERRLGERRSAREDTRVFPRERRRREANRRYPIRPLTPDFLAPDDEIIEEILLRRKNGGGGDETRIVPLEMMERQR